METTIDVGGLDDRVPARNVTVTPRELHMEVFDQASGDVWLCSDPVTREEYKAFAPEPPLVKSGLGTGRMDAAFFTRSPGAAEDGPLEQRVIEGRDFVLVARPELPFETPPAGHPLRITVHKHHVVFFEAGVPLLVVRLPDGRDFVHVVERRFAGERSLPEGWVLRSLVPAGRLRVELPAPTTVFFFSNGESFQGPVTLPD
jgi:hypothetical protein